MSVKNKTEWFRSVNIPAVIFLVAGILCGIMVVRSMEHYRRVYDHFLTVRAVVTHHDISSGDDDTIYESYISYDADGVAYSDICFERKRDEDELTAVGEEVEVQVSSEKPNELMSELKNNMEAMVYLVPLMIGFVIIMPGQWRKKSPTAAWGLYWLLTAGGFLALYLRYCAVLVRKNGLLIGAVVCTGLFLICAGKLLRRKMHTKKKVGKKNDHYIQGV